MRINQVFSVVLATISFIATQTFESVGVQRYYRYRASVFKKEKGYYDLRHPDSKDFIHFSDAINRFARMDSTHWIVHPQCCTRGLKIQSSDINTISEILPLPNSSQLIDFVTVDSTLFLIDSEMDIYQSFYPFDSSTTIQVSKNLPNWKSSALCYDRETNRLLFSSSDEDPSSRLRYIGYYSISQHRYGKDMLFSFDADAVVQKLPLIIFSRCEELSNHKIFKHSIPEIRPNAMAINPKTNDIYLLCSNDRILVVFTQFGNILAVNYLDECTYPNPSDLGFSTRGDLMIINQYKENSSLLLLPWNKLWQHQAGEEDISVFN